MKHPVAARNFICAMWHTILQQQCAFHLADINKYLQRNMACFRMNRIHLRSMSFLGVTVTGRGLGHSLRHVLPMLSCIAILIAQAWQHIPVPAFGKQGKGDSIQGHLGIRNRNFSFPVMILNLNCQLDEI